MKKIVLTVLLSLFVGCTTFEIPLVSASKPLDQNIALWKQKHVTSYSIDYRRSCFCIFTSTVRLVVKNDKIVELLDPTSGKPLKESEYSKLLPPNLDASWFQTIDGVFAQLTELSKGKPRMLDMEFDPTYGFPTSVSYDQNAMIADEEFILYLTNFKILP